VTDVNLVLLTKERKPVGKPVVLRVIKFKDPQALHLFFGKPDVEVHDFLSCRFHYNPRYSCENLKPVLGA
jgi:hypothetical protein